MNIMEHIENKQILTTENIEEYIFLGQAITITDRNGTGNSKEK